MFPSGLISINEQMKHFEIPQNDFFINLLFMDFFDKLKNYDNNKLSKLPKSITTEKASILNFLCKWNDYSKFL